MTMQQLVEWVAYSELEPWGDEREDLRAGIVAATIHNCHVTRKQDAKGPDAFMPKLGVAHRRAAKEKPVTTAEGWAAFKGKFKSKVVAGGLSNSEARARGLI